MKKSLQELQAVESLIKRAYNRRGRRLHEKLDKPYGPKNPSIGYSWKSEESGKINYYVVVSSFPDYPETEYRVKLHEYGHVYLTHFEGIHEELDSTLCRVLNQHRGQIIDLINKNCGITNGELLVNRIIDDPVVNHSLHNIAMDMEVNSKILSDEDIEEMEDDLSKVHAELFEADLKKVSDKLDDDDVKKDLEDKLNKMKKEKTIKLILPSRYHTPDGKPFPNELTYPQYLVMIVQNLDQFVKMLVSVNAGGNGDTSGVSAEDIKEALGEKGAESLSDLLRKSGLLDDSDGSGSESGDTDGSNSAGMNSELPQHDTSNTGGYSGEGQEKDGYTDRGESNLDHCTNSRKEADEKRKLGKITAGGGIGVGNSDVDFGLRETVKSGDYVDEAINEVIKEQKSRVIKSRTKYDRMRFWNLGINRSALVPSYEQSFRFDTTYKIVYLIDVSGSMDTDLIDRILNTIAKKMRKINKGLRYDIISWSTRLHDHIKDIDPSKGLKEISIGGGTRLAEGIDYFRQNYNETATLVVVSDFEDYLEEWIKVLNKMKGYSVWGFNYGCSNFNVKMKWPRNFKLKNFNLNKSR